MTKYILKRFFQMVPTLLGVTLVAFALVRLTGDPAALLLPPEATAEQRAVYRHAYGLDQPWPVQYLMYLRQLLRLDLGQSLAYHEPALRLILERLPATLELAAAALLLALVVGAPVGVVSAVWRNSVWDRLGMVWVLLGQSIATFWLGILLILLFAVYLQLLPVSGRGAGEVRHLVLPAVTLAAYLAALIARLTRSGMLEVLGEDYIRTARAKGLRGRIVICRHALCNALLPIVTVLGLQLGGLLGGAIVTETVFQWPGVGTLLMETILRRDYPVVQAVLLLLAAIYSLINLTIDLLYGYLDPRIRVERS